MMPALLTRTTGGPSSSATRATPASTCAASRDVDPHAEGAATGIPDPSGHGLAGGLVEVEHRHGEPVAGQPLGGGRADASGRSGDDRDSLGGHAGSSWTVAGALGAERRGPRRRGDPTERGRRTSRPACDGVFAPSPLAGRLTQTPDGPHGPGRAPSTVAGPAVTTHGRQPVEIWPGTPYPLGATYDGSGVNFALFSEVAERVELCLVDDDGAETRLDLPEVDGFV